MRRFPKSLFWDIDSSTLDKNADSTYIIERVLEHGDEKAVRWLLEIFPKHRIAEVAKKSRRLSARSRNYWHLYFNIWQTPARSRRQQHAIWKF